MPFRSDRRVGGIFDHWKAQRAGPTSGGPEGLAAPHDEEAIGGQSERDVVMEAAPLVIAETDFLFEIAIALLDPPAVFGGGDHRLDRRVPGQRDQPVSHRIAVAHRPFDQQGPLAFVLDIDPRRREARSGPLPSRHVIQRHADRGSRAASARTDTGPS